MTEELPEDQRQAMAVLAPHRARAIEAMLAQLEGDGDATQVPYFDVFQDLHDDMTRIAAPINRIAQLRAARQNPSPQAWMDALNAANTGRALQEDVMMKMVGAYSGIAFQLAAMVGDLRQPPESTADVIKGLASPGYGDLESNVV